LEHFLSIRFSLLKVRNTHRSHLTFCLIEKLQENNYLYINECQTNYLRNTIAIVDKKYFSPLKDEREKWDDEKRNEKYISQKNEYR